MFSADAVLACERKDPCGNGKPLYWASLVPMAETLPVITNTLCMLREEFFSMPHR
jgi:hypothetical protein